MRDLLDFAGGSLGLWLVMLALAGATFVLEALVRAIRRRLAERSA